eukprot:jgi/Mesvir1/23517/Mv18223-RA.1
MVAIGRDTQQGGMPGTGRPGRQGSEVIAAEKEFDRVFERCMASMTNEMIALKSAVDALVRDLDETSAALREFPTRFPGPDHRAEQQGAPMDKGSHPAGGHPWLAAGATRSQRAHGAWPADPGWGAGPQQARVRPQGGAHAGECEHDYGVPLEGDSGAHGQGGSGVQRQGERGVHQEGNYPLIEAALAARRRRHSGKQAAVSVAAADVLRGAGGGEDQAEQDGAPQREAGGEEGHTRQASVGHPTSTAGGMMMSGRHGNDTGSTGGGGDGRGSPTVSARRSHDRGGFGQPCHRGASKWHEEECCGAGVGGDTRWPGGGVQGAHPPYASRGAKRVPPAGVGADGSSYGTAGDRFRAFHQRAAMCDQPGTEGASAALRLARVGRTLKERAQRSAAALVIQRCARRWLQRRERALSLRLADLRGVLLRHRARRCLATWQAHAALRAGMRARVLADAGASKALGGSSTHGDAGDGYDQADRGGMVLGKPFDGTAICLMEGKWVMAARYHAWRLLRVCLTRWLCHTLDMVD